MMSASAPSALMVRQHNKQVVHEPCANICHNINVLVYYDLTKSYEDMDVCDACGIRFTLYDACSVHATSNVNGIKTKVCL